MPTRTKPQPSSRLGRRSTRAPQGRFSRPGRPAHSGRPNLHGRRKPQQSTAKKAMAALTGALSRPAPAKKGGKRRAGGMALLAGGLGLAMKNRDKLQGLMGRRGRQEAPRQTPPTTPPPAPLP
jgi:hypothetical protein